MPRDSLDQVYGLIAAGRFLDAIHFVNKILRKQPNYLIAKVWKCEALYGLGNIADSEDLMNSIMEQKSQWDKRAIESIAEFFRARGNYGKLIEVYEDAIKKEPGEESWRKALFESSGLAGDYKKQQQQALLLYKQTSIMRFYCMAVVCLLQQAQDNPVALELAERMMSKQVDGGNIKSTNEILLLINVFEQRGKFTEALKLLDASEADLESLICKFDKRIELLQKLDRWQDMVVELKKYLSDKPDSWTHYERYLEAVLKLESLGGAVDHPDADDTYERAYQFLAGLKDEHPSLRGPYLAAIKLNTLPKNGVVQDEELLTLLHDYFERFGAKAISVFDLSNYLPKLSEVEAKKLLESLASPDGAAKDTMQLLGTAKHVSFVQIGKLLGSYETLSVQQLEEHCGDLMRCYLAAGDCDRQGQYLVLLAQARFKLFRINSEAKYLVSAITELESSLERGPSIFAVQVLLLQLYYALGATKSARKLHEQLKIQSVQVDTLSHLLLTNLASTGNFSVAFEMWENALKILQQCTAESLEALVWCYRAGLFHRVDEFTRCARRFQQTLTVPYLRLEKAHLDVVVAEPGRTEQLLARTRTRVDWTKCMDNRDFSALPTWSPPSQRVPLDVSYRELVLYCQLREATLHCMGCAIAYAKVREEETQRKFRASLDELQSYYSEALSYTSDQRRDPSAVPSTRLLLIIQRPLPGLIDKILEGDAASIDKVCATLKQSTEDSVGAINAGRSRNPRLSLETIVTQIELLAMVTVVCGAARSGQQAPQKRRSEQVVRMLEASWNQLEASVLSMQSSSLEAPISLETKLRENYTSAVDDMKKAIRKKLAYLHKL